ncbi:MAG: glycoside hydrolase family 57 protein [Bacteroidales bacterium]|nr:glycoside hydrolase family 57 protein [Bacteroidales bacterium]MCF8456494.1 glycoside hydrolase family 57 protein [Bacteroidales bacterium]
MKTICLYFQVHQPFRLKRYRFFDIGNDHYYFDDFNNRAIMEKVANNCYLPANQVMLELIEKYGKKFKVTYSLSGSVMEQFEMYAPEVLESFKKLAATGSVEFLAETYSHSLSSLRDKDEFVRQVKLHGDLIKKHFKQTPTVFRNTELVYSDEIGEMVAQLGYKAMITEGAKHILGWKSPNYLYNNTIDPKLKLLLKNYTLSDDIAFRFSNQGWGEWPLTADKYVGWIKAIDPKQEVLNLFMDYETFGEHQDARTGIFEFLKAFPSQIIDKTNIGFLTASEVAKKFDPVSAINVPDAISWADEERDLTAWLGNELQDEAYEKLYALLPIIEKFTGKDIISDWQKLQNSDHFYYMCTKWFSDGDVHKYFNPYNSPYDAFINYMNVISDFTSRVKALCPVSVEEELSEEEIQAKIKSYQASLRKIKAQKKNPKGKK